MNALEKKPTLWIEACKDKDLFEYGGTQLPLLLCMLNRFRDEAVTVLSSQNNDSPLIQQTAKFRYNVNIKAPDGKDRTFPGSILNTALYQSLRWDDKENPHQLLNALLEFDSIKKINHVTHPCYPSLLTIYRDNYPEPKTRPDLDIYIKKQEAIAKTSKATAVTRRKRKRAQKEQKNSRRKIEPNSAPHPATATASSAADSLDPFQREIMDFIKTGKGKLPFLWNDSNKDSLKNLLSIEYGKLNQTTEPTREEFPGVGEFPVISRLLQMYPETREYLIEFINGKAPSEQTQIYATLESQTGLDTNHNAIPFFNTALFASVTDPQARLLKLLVRNPKFLESFTNNASYQNLEILYQERRSGLHNKLKGTEVTIPKSGVKDETLKKFPLLKKGENGKYDSEKFKTDFPENFENWVKKHFSDRLGAQWSAPKTA